MTLSNASVVDRIQRNLASRLLSKEGNGVEVGRSTGPSECHRNPGHLTQVQGTVDAGACETSRASFYKGEYSPFFFFSSFLPPPPSPSCVKCVRDRRRECTHAGSVPEPLCDRWGSGKISVVPVGTTFPAPPFPYAAIGHDELGSGMGVNSNPSPCRSTVGVASSLAEVLLVLHAYAGPSRASLPPGLSAHRSLRRLPPLRRRVCRHCWLVTSNDATRYVFVFIL